MVGVDEGVDAFLQKTENSFEAHSLNMCAILKCFTSPVNNYILLFQFSTMTLSDPLCVYFISSDSHVQQLTKTSYRLKKIKA